MGTPARWRAGPAGEVKGPRVKGPRVPCPQAMRGEAHPAHPWPAAGDLADPATCVWARCTGQPPTPVELAAVALNIALGEARAAILPAICARFDVTPAQIQEEFRLRAVEELDEHRGDRGTDGV